MITEKVMDYMERQALAPPGTRILCACSGGADSMALLRLLSRRAEYTVVCAHFNHRLRGAEADRDEAFVRAWCASEGVPFRAGGADVSAWAKERGKGTEEAARLLRYAFLEQCAAETGCGRIATAHNADDNAETVLLQLLRGAGARGLSGIPPCRGKVIRPLLCVSRGEITAALEQWGVPHVEDSSNAGDAYARNRVRHHLLPLLRELNPAAVAHINAAAELLGEDEAYLEGLAQGFLAEHRRPGGEVPIPELLALPRPVALRVLRDLCPGAGREQLRGLYALCAGEKPHGSFSLPGRMACRDRELLLFDPVPVSAEPRQALSAGVPAVFPSAGKLVCCAETVFTEEIHSSFNTFYFNYDNICGRIHAGFREPGDRIRLAGRGCGKSLKKLFTEAKLPLAERRRRIVISDEMGVLAVEGFGAAERTVPAAGDRILRVEIRETEAHTYH